MAQANVIVVGNEKGGAGKSTIAIHTAVALLHGLAQGGYRRPLSGDPGAD